MTDRSPERTEPSADPSAGRSIPRGTDEHAPDDGDTEAQRSDGGTAKRGRERKPE